MNTENKEKKKQKIQWDEETIALHDKERGSRQKIEEAPTPYRYLSESDQSESEGESLAANSVEADTVTMDNTDTNSQIHYQMKGGGGGCNNHSTTMVSDSWEVLNAKLQYEKYLQELKDKGIDPSVLNAPRRHLNDGKHSSVGEGDFLMPPRPPASGGVGGEMCLPEITTPSATPVTSSSSLSVMNSNSLNSSQTNFDVTNTASGSVGLGLDEQQIGHAGVAHPAPAAWSPFFTRKHYRKDSMGKSSLRSKSDGGDGDDEKGSHRKVPKSVCINEHNETVTPTQATFRHSNNFLSSSGAAAAPNSPGAGAAPSSTVASGGIAVGTGNDNIFAGINGSIGGDDSSRRKEQFRNKRAGHYNEFKVLQAMRAKIAAEEAEEEEEEEDATASVVMAENNRSRAAIEEAAEEMFLGSNEES